ncbi:dehydrogenase/reductase SDR family member on chromosome X-like isoform X1 [Corticium candelabrum]|uniref:dehydrogenase/reductase SDR family member on chromosome X-like isoform X1 n=1 Tax=Corticium candelabrum TaxID=121492 RepID=UPI002E25B75A|nr:dehydrogenase/reductase SDR family member on chromosome X-like isoform X1 [Corticium candelabrum]
MQTMASWPKTPLQEMSGRVAIVTGASSGIGLETVKGLCKAGATVVIACKNQAASERAVKDITNDVNTSKVEYMFLNLASFQSIRSFVKRFLARNWPLHILVNNAGVMLAPYTESEDGHEMHIAVNYLGHFLLTQLLLDRLKESASATTFSRIVNVSSCVHDVGAIQIDDLNGQLSLTPDSRYAQSKLAVVLFSHKLQRLLSTHGCYVTSNVLHPGIVASDLYRHAPLWCRAVLGFPGLKGVTFKTSEQGAATTLYACLSPEMEGVGGKYLVNSNIVSSSSASYNTQLQDSLWTETLNLLKLD